MGGEKDRGDIIKSGNILPPGWEWFWFEKPWTNKWERQMLPHEEAEKRRRTCPCGRPSYWGQKEKREQRRKIREERAKIERAKKENQMDEGWNKRERERCMELPGLQRIRNLNVLYLRRVIQPFYQHPSIEPQK